MNDAAFMHPDAEAYERIRTWLYARAGMFYPERKQELLVHRLARVLDRFGIRNMLALAECIEGGAREDVARAVIDAASTNHTYFFREPQVLNYFRDQILPGLAQRSDIRVWSAAASSGDEAYTIAIIAAEALGRLQAIRRLSILGTDISEPVLARAESGIYGKSHLEHTAPELRTRYFKPCGIDQLQVQLDIRSMCTFRRLNLKATPFPFRNAFSVIFCRNILYYFDKAHQLAALEAIYDVTEPGGWLLTSVTESVRELGSRWHPVDTGVYRRLP